ncbi:MAG: hypothetical protein ACRDBG_28025 [Waterburya sp.]
MEDLFNYPQQRNRQYPVERIATEVTDWQSRHKLPRHICQLETKTHRGQSQMGQMNHKPRICKIEPNPTTTGHLAWDILRYQLSDRQAKQKHIENVRSNLERRLQVAKAQGNNQLVKILRDEFRQLETSV